jgi:glucose-1-phosphate thymidylyltransferase
VKAIILAAGYGTRLQQELDKLKIDNPEQYRKISDSIEGKAKPLVLIAGKPLIQYTVENIERAGIDQVLVVTNNKYFNDFEEWKKNYSGKSQVKILDDGSSTNDDRLGAIGDLCFVLEREKTVEDSLVIAGDNLLKFELEDLIEFYGQKKTSVVVAYKETDKDKIKKSANIVFDQDQRITWFEEKPKSPRSEWICPAIYIYTSDILTLLKKMKFPASMKDLIGNIPMLFYAKKRFHAFVQEEKIRFDLGTTDDFEKADAYFRNRK